MHRELTYNNIARQLQHKLQPKTGGGANANLVQGGCMDGDFPVSVDFAMDALTNIPINACITATVREESLSICVCSR